MHSSMELFLVVLHIIFFPSHWLKYHITIVETMPSALVREEGTLSQRQSSIFGKKSTERGSNHRPPFFKYCKLPTDLHGLGAAGIEENLRTEVAGSNPQLGQFRQFDDSQCYSTRTSLTADHCSMMILTESNPILATSLCGINNKGSLVRVFAWRISF